jgi:hypothetical protein
LDLPIAPGFDDETAQWWILESAPGVGPNQVSTAARSGARTGEHTQLVEEDPLATVKVREATFHPARERFVVNPPNDETSDRRHEVILLFPPEHPPRGSGIPHSFLLFEDRHEGDP